MQTGTLTLFFVGLTLSLGVLVLSPHDAQAQVMPNDFPATTEKSCSFGMDKDEPSQQCFVPIPLGCQVANIPGTKKPWTTISKGGNIQCRFDEKVTNWKTTINGTCGRCRSGHCSVQFSVRFDCNPH